MATTFGMGHVHDCTHTLFYYTLITTMVKNQELKNQERSRSRTIIIGMFATLCPVTSWSSTEWFSVHNIYINPYTIEAVVPILDAGAVWMAELQVTSHVITNTHVQRGHHTQSHTHTVQRGQHIHRQSYVHNSPTGTHSNSTEGTTTST